MNNWLLIIVVGFTIAIATKFGGVPVGLAATGMAAMVRWDDD